VPDPFSQTDARAPRAIALRLRADPAAQHARRAQRRVATTALVVLGAGSAWLAAHFGLRQALLLRSCSGSGCSSAADAGLNPAHLMNPAHRP
jgi:hypothetical protein